MTPTPDDIPVTEQENARTRDISSRSTAEMLRLINEEDSTVPAAIAHQLTQITDAVEGIVDRLRHGGRLFYVGTGTSGRLGVLDAVECPPTFSSAPDQVIGLIAGGPGAILRAVEASEDDRQAGAHDLDARGVTSRDAVVGIAASGRTPYTIGAVAHARSLGAFTAAIACVPGSPITAAVDVAIVPVVGPEVLAGSTRMKAGTAQKLVLNMLSTATMMRLGYVSGNRMTNLRARNSKLQARSIRILMAEANLAEKAAVDVLDLAGGELPTAVVMARTSRTAVEARAALDASGGVIAAAVERLSNP